MGLPDTPQRALRSLRSLTLQVQRSDRSDPRLLLRLTRLVEKAPILVLQVHRPPAGAVPLALDRLHGRPPELPRGELSQRIPELPGRFIRLVPPSPYSSLPSGWIVTRGTVVPSMMTVGCGHGETAVKPISSADM